MNLVHLLLEKLRVRCASFSLLINTECAKKQWTTQITVKSSSLTIYTSSFQILWPLYQQPVGEAWWKEGVWHTQSRYWRETSLYHARYLSKCYLLVIFLYSPFTCHFKTTVSACCVYMTFLFPLGTPEDVELAVRAARKAFESWSKLPCHVRARHMYSIARHVQKHAR